MNIGNYTKTLRDDLRKSLLITLTLLFVCPGVWGDTFPAAVNGVKTLADKATYNLINDTHFDDGYLYIPSGCTVTIQFSSNQTLSRSLPSTTENGYVIKNEGTLNIIGNGNYPCLSGGKNTGNGGCIYNSGKLNVNGISFRNNQTEGNGGAVYNTSSGVVTLTNCRMGYSYWYNSAVNGAGVYNEGELTIEGGQFNGNTASGQGGAIYQADGTLTIKSSPVIATNKVGDVINNVYLPTGKTIAIDGVLGSGANIGITVETRGTFTTGSTTASNVSKFFSDIVGVDIVDAGDNNAKIQTQWDELQELLTAAESSGTLQLTRDYTAVAGVDVPLTFTGNVTIDLNGHIIDRGLSSASPATNGYLVSIASGNSLTINDTGSGGTITGGKVSGNGGAIINAGTLTVSGGTITGNSATGNGGAVFNTGTATISGGTLSSNSASQGGAIYNNGTLTVSSGAIQNNTASTNGGGIYHYDGTLNMSGAPTISGNQQGTADNNVYLASGKTITVNADLTNTTPIGITRANIGVFTTGLNTYAGDYTKFVSDDTRFVTANSSGNAKLQTYWMDLQEQLTAGDVTLARNYEYLSGFDNAGLTVSADRTLNLGSYKIDRKLSTATENGYVIKVTGGTLTVTGTGQITGGYNSGNGGGIHIASGGTLHLSGGNITGNTAALGGGVYNGGTLQMSGAPIVTGNTGGNVYLPNGHSIITLVGTMNGSDGNIGITMQTPGVFTSGMNTYGTISKFASDNGDYEVAPNGDEATLLSHWAALKATLAKGGTVNLTRDYVAPSAGDGYLEVPNTKTVALDLKGHTINRNLTEATADGYVIKVIAGGTLTISDSGTGGTITGGNNSSDADGQRGGGICNLGTVSLQGGIISGNQSVKGGGIYNENTLNVSGGTITSNTATGNGGGIYNNGTTFTMNGAPNISGNTGGNTYLPAAHPTITISAALSNTTAIGITMETNGIFTSGLSGKGNATNFASDNSSYGIGLNSSNEAVIGNKRTIRRDEPNSTYTYMYIKGNYIDDPIEAVVGERVKVTISGDGTYKTIPVSLSYTDGTLSTYPKGGVEYGFDMPDHDVTVTGLCLKGGYCGNANDEDIKYYLEGTTLKFQAKDASNYAMKSTYASQNEVPWYSRTEIQNVYTSVEIPSNITNISPYAFYGSGLTTAVIPASVNTIGAKAFMGCTSLTAINVNAGNANFMNNSSDGVLYTKSAENPTNLICYPAGKSDVNYSVPSTVTAITDGAFAFNTHLESITVAGGSSFSATNGVLYNAGGTELYCYPARKTGDVYDVASTVTEIKPYAFHNNNLLKAVNFCETTVPTGGTEMFGGTNTAKIMVTKGLKSGDGIKYNNTAPWSTTNYINRTYEMDLANAVVSLAYDTYSYDDYAYAAVKPAVTSVTLTTGNLTQTLRSGIDYVAINDGSYSNNTAVGNATVTITGAGGYDGTSKGKNFTIKRHLNISGATNYFTYFANENLSLYYPEYYHAYTIIAVNWTTGVVTLSELDYIPENKPVLVYSPNYSHCQINNDYYFTAHAAGSPTGPCANFKGETTAKRLEQLKTENNASEIYVLRGNNFVRATSGELPARHCYIFKPSGGVSAPSQLIISFEGVNNTTDIGSVEDESLENGNEKIYDLSGRQVKTPGKGVYIINGKKIMIK